MLRNIGGVIAGLLVGVVAMMLIAMLGGMLFPTDVRVDPSDSAQISAAFDASPTGAKLVIILSWFTAALAGGAVAKLISGERWAAWTVAALFALYVLASVFVLPMPAWMQVLAVAAPLIGGWIASHFGRRTAAADGEIAAHEEV